MNQFLQQIALIQCYIHHRKDVQVNIDLGSAMRRPDLAEKAFRIARAYFDR